MEDKKTQSDKTTTSKYRRIKYAQCHVGFAPHGLESGLSLTMMGPKAMELIEERPNGVYAMHKKGREFLIPYSNIQYLEYES